MVLLFDDADVHHDDDMPPLLELDDPEPNTSHLYQVQDQLPYWARANIMTMQQTVALTEMLPSEQMAPHFYTVRDLTCDNHSSHREDLSPCTPTIILMSPTMMDSESSSVPNEEPSTEPHEG